MSDNAEISAVVVSENHLGRYQQQVRIGRHTLVTDEPESAGGDDAGPAPYDLLMAALGSCTSITIRMYAELKKIPLEHVSVALEHDKVLPSGEVLKRDRFSRVITLQGNLRPKERAKLLEIANKCPVHRTLHSAIIVETRLAEEQSEPA
jgi:putative redox protein